MTNHYDRPWSIQPHTQREMAQLKTRQEQVHALITVVCRLVQLTKTSCKYKTLFYGLQKN